MPKPIKEVKPHETEVITSELAEIVGKSAQWIRQLTRDGVLKQSGRGKYVLGQSVQAYITHASGGKEEDQRPRLIDHKTEHERIKTEKAQLELAQMRGELHRSDDVEMVMSDMLNAFRQKILAIPTKLAPQLTGIEEIPILKARLTNALYEALNELKDYDPSLFLEGGTGAGEDAET